MKKIFTLLFFVAMGTTWSQTLTQTFNEPVAGDFERTVALDTSGYTVRVPVNITGPNSNWNFDKLKTASNPALSAYVTPSAVPAASAYPSCNLVQDDGGFYTFLKSVSTPTTRTELLGFNLAVGTVSLSNTAITAVYPISAGSTFSDNASGSLTFSGTTYPITGRVSYTADGTGTLTLGDGFIFNNVIRLKTIQTFTATLLGFPLAELKSTSYTYYDMSLKFPVLSIDYSSFGLIGSASVTASYRGHASAFTGISSAGLLQEQLHLYPNPANEEVTITLPESGAEARLRVFDSAGRLAIETTVTGGSVMLDLRPLPAGIYQIVVDGDRLHSSTKLVRELR
jgi:hypothetical protein